MEYRLDLWQTLEVLALGDGFLWLLYNILKPILMIFVIVVVCKVVPVENRKVYLIFFTLTFISMLTMDALLYRSGWQIYKNNMHMKFQYYSADVQITTMEICIVQPDSDWWPAYRNIGGEFARLSIGKYHMRNGKNALLFNHYKQKKLLLISSNNKYYFIGNLNIELLYQELIRLGAKPKEIKINEVMP